MTKNEFISEMLKREKIENFDERVKSVKEYLVNNIPNNSKAHLKYPEIDIKMNDVEKYYTKYITTRKASVSFENIVGTTHPNYKGESPFEMLNNGSKKMSDSLDWLTSEADYYFNNREKKKGSISYVCYVDEETQEQQLIIEQGNNRSTIGIIISTMCSDKTGISYVPVTNYTVNWALINKIQIAEQLIHKNGISLDIERSYEYIDGTSYNTINRVSLLCEYNEIYKEWYVNDKDNMERSMAENESKLSSFCDNIERYIPQNKLKKDKTSEKMTKYDTLVKWLLN